MLCQICKSREAELILNSTINGIKSEFHICKECAVLFEHQLSSLALPQFNLNDLLIGLLSALDFYEKEGSIPVYRKMICTNCQLSYEEFQKTGKLGCSQCYQFFIEKLKPILIKLQGNHQHYGKIPHNMINANNMRKEISKLKKELDNAVQKEEYEKAARLRDEIIKYERINKVR